MFTKQQILDEVKNYANGQDSEVVDAWMDMATDWLSDDPSTYLRDGFDGFNDRSPNQILCDFYLAGKVSDLSEDEFNQIMDNL